MCLPCATRPAASRLEASAGAVATIAFALFFPSRPAHAQRAVEYESVHYKLWCTAAAPRCSLSLEVAEKLHATWEAWTGDDSRHRIDRHRIRLFRSHPEMILALRETGTADGLYRDRTTEQFDDTARDPEMHTVAHEGTHQLLAEDAGIILPQWAAEGLACLFGTSRLSRKKIVLGSTDPRAFPAWTLVDLDLSGRMSEDSLEGRIVPPSHFLSQQPGIRRVGLNVRYVSWWSLVHYLNAENPLAWKDWVLHDRTTKGLEKRFGPMSTLDQRWYAHLLALRDSVKSAW